MHIPPLKNERGSITILVAVVVSTLLVMMSASSSVTTVFAGKTLMKSLAVKVGKRGNGGTLGLTAALFDGGTVRYVANTDGTLTWLPTNFATNSYSYNNNAATTNLPTIDTPTCNPLFYDLTVATNIFAAKTLPDATACTNSGIDLSPRLTVTSISGGGIWSRTSPNFLTVEVQSAALLARAAAGPTVPATDSARITLHAPRPQCWMTFAAPEIIVGQTTTLTLATSRNTDKALMQRIPGGGFVAFPGVPPAPALADYAQNQGGSMSITPTVPGVYRYMGQVFGPVDPASGVAQSDFCEQSLRVYPEPKCTLYADPGLIVTTQSAVLRFQDNGNETPIRKAILDGTDVTAQQATTFLATKDVAPGRIGVFRYNATVTGVNNFTKGCAADLVVQPPPFCSISAPNKTQIIYGDLVSATMTTNYPADTINTAVFEGQNIGVGGGTINTAPPVLGSYKLSGYVLGPNGSSATCQSPTPIQVFPAPFCGVVAYPAAVEVGTPVTFSMTTNNASSPILNASLAGYGVGPNGGTVTLSAPGSPGTYTANGIVYGVNGSSHLCTSNAYAVYPRASCSMSASANNVTLGDGVVLYLNTNAASDPTIVDSSACYGNACHRFGPGGGSLFWATNASGGEPSFPAGVGTFHFNGNVRGNYGSTAGSCGTDVRVNAPPPPLCPYRNVAYLGSVTVPGHPGVYPFSRTYNSSRHTGGCTDYYDTSYHNYPGPFPGGQVMDVGQNVAFAGGNLACAVGNNDCLLYNFLYACANPDAFVIINLDDPNCVPAVWHVREVGGGCFDGDVAMTLADGTTKLARDMRQGDRLLNPSTKRGARIKQMTRGSEEIPMWEVGIDGHRVKVTETHPFLTKRGMRAAKELAKGDEILSASGEMRPVTMLEKLPVQKGQIVYNFELEAESAGDGDHQIVGNGIVTGDLLVQKRLGKLK